MNPISSIVPLTKTRGKPNMASISKLDGVKVWGIPLPFASASGLKLPLYLSKVQAGFPSPADDFKEGPLDLREYLVPHPASTFLVRAAGDSMREAGIFPNSLLVVDRSVAPVSGKIVIAVVDGEFTVKRLVKKGARAWLMPENPCYAPLEITQHPDVMLWGVVTRVIQEV
jgi:DNA polymerase V